MPEDGISTAGVLFPALNFVLRTFRTGYELSIESVEDRELLNTVDRIAADCLLANGLLNKKKHLLIGDEITRAEQAIQKTENALDRLTTILQQEKAAVADRRRGSRSRRQQQAQHVRKESELAAEQLLMVDRELQNQITSMKSRTAQRSSADSQSVSSPRAQGKGSSFINKDPPPAYAQGTSDPFRERQEYLRHSAATSSTWSDRPLPATPRSLPSSEGISRYSVVSSSSSGFAMSPSELPGSITSSPVTPRFPTVLVPAETDCMSPNINNIADYVQYNHNVMSSLSRSRMPPQNVGSSLNRPFPAFTTPIPGRPLPAASHSYHLASAPIPAPLSLPKTRRVVTEPSVHPSHSMAPSNMVVTESIPSSTRAVVNENHSAAVLNRQGGVVGRSESERRQSF